MLYREIIAVCSEIHTKHISTLCGQNAEFVDVKLVVHGCKGLKQATFRGILHIHHLITAPKRNKWCSVNLRDKCCRPPCNCHIPWLFGTWMTLSVSESLSAQPAGPDRSDSLWRSSDVSSKIVSKNRNCCCCCWPGISTVAPSVNINENKLL